MQKQVRKRLITLSISGRFVQLCGAVEKTILPDGFDWANAICDALVLSGITFFSTIGATAYVGVDGKDVFIAGLIAAGAQFFTVLALKRKLIKQDESKP